MSPVEKQSFGTNGCYVVPASSSAPTGAYCAIQFVTEGTIAAITTNSLQTGSAISGFTFPAGFVLYVPFTAVTTGASTVVVAYKSSL